MAHSVCGGCGHPLKMHCKGNEWHASYKDEARMTRNPKMHKCATRHCTAPLCSCLDFAEAAA